MYTVPQKYKKIFKNDALGIAQDVIEFAHLISNDRYRKEESSKVYSISANFGVGKTFFCEKLNDVLRKDDVKSVIFNVWKSDFYEDPLIPILAELNKIYMLDNPNNVPLPDKVLKHRSLVKIVGSGIKLSGKIKVPYVGEFGAELDGSQMVAEHNRQETATEQVRDTSIYDDYAQYEAAMTELKDTIKKWIAKKRKPAVLIIDELDRCRPDYAVKTLEVIKHFFDISGLVFVLAIDEDQLQNSVQRLFGTTDFDGYKRKFISNSFRLADPDNLKFAEMLYDKSGIESIVQKFHAIKHDLLIPTTTEIYVSESNSEGGNYLFIKQNVSDMPAFEWHETREIITKYFAAFASPHMFNFSLRKQEQVFDRIILFIKTLGVKNYLSPDLTVFLACLHEHDKNLFSELKQRATSTIEPTELLSKLLDQLSDSRPSNLYEHGWEKVSDIRKNLLLGIRQVNRNDQSFYGFSYTNKVTYIDKFSVFFDIANNDRRMAVYGWKNFDTRGLLDLYFSKMEFVSRFSGETKSE